MDKVKAQLFAAALRRIPVDGEIPESVTLAFAELSEHAGLDALLLSMQFEETQVRTGSADKPNPHTHGALVDPSTGNGVTSFDEGHRHLVREWKVIAEADHEHTLERPEPEKLSGDFRTIGLIELSGDPQAGEDGLIEGQAIQIGKTGKFVHPQYGEFEITTAMLDELVSNAQRLGRDIPFDYDHKSAGGSPAPDAGKAAGWVRRLFRQGSKLFAVPAWTAKGWEAVKSREFRYISPEFARKYQTDDGTKLGATLLAVALTNRPFLKGMDPIAASESAQLIALAEGQNRLFVEQPEGKHMDREALIKALGLSEKATDEEINTALTERQAAAGQVTKLGEFVKTLLGKFGIKIDGDDMDPAKVLAQIDADVVPKLTDKPEPGSEVIKLGGDTYTAEDVRKLKEDAEAGAAAAASLKLRDRDDAIAKLVRERKISTDAEKENFGKLFLSDKASFDSITASLQPRTEIEPGRKGHDQDAPAPEGSARAEVVALCEKIAAERKVDFGDAMTLAESEYPELFGRYNAELEGRPQQ